MNKLTLTFDSNLKTDRTSIQNIFQYSTMEFLALFETMPETPTFNWITPGGQKLEERILFRDASQDTNTHYAYVAVIYPGMTTGTSGYVRMSVRSGNSMSPLVRIPVDETIMPNQTELPETKYDTIMSYLTGNGDMSFGSVTLYNADGDATANYDGNNIIWNYRGVEAEMFNNLFVDVVTDEPNIYHGDVLMYTGQLGANGKMKVKKATREVLNQNPYVIAGVATTDLPTAGTEAMINWYGTVNEIDTSGYTERKAVWVDTREGAAPGSWTLERPDAPNVQILLGKLKSLAVDGSIEIRPEIGRGLEDLHNVFTDGHTFQGGEVIKYDIANSRWEVYDLDGAINTINTRITDLEDTRQVINYGDYVEKSTLSLTDMITINDSDDENQIKRTSINTLSDFITSELSQFGFIKVTTLPTTGLSNKIYLVDSPDPETNNSLVEYIYVDGSWEQVGRLDVDLSAYYTESEVDALLNERAYELHTHSESDITDLDKYSKQEADNLLNLKVDKEAGKGLTENNLTDALKSNYDSAYDHSTSPHAPTDAEKNVQSDWNETDDLQDSFIKNKPSIPQNTSDLTNDSGFATEQYVKDKTSTVYEFKGTVATNQDLPTTGMEIGDVYSVQDSGANFVWDGTEWDSLGGTVDLSNYALKSEVPTDNSELTNGAGYLVDYTETDPVFTAWDKSTGISITKSQVTDFPTLATVATTGNYTDLINKPNVPTNVSELNNDAGYLTDYTETDPLFTAWDRSTGISIHKSQITDFPAISEVGKTGQYTDLLNTPEIPERTSQLTNDSEFATEDYVKNQTVNLYKYKGSVPTYDDLPTVDVLIGHVYNVSDTGQNYAWTGDHWDGLGAGADLTDYALKTEIPDNVSELNNDLGFMTDYTETDPLFSAWDKSSGISIAISQITDFPSLAMVATSGSYNDLINKPNLFSGSYLDLTDKPTLFSGSYTDLTDKPTIPTATSDLTNDSDFATELYVDNKISSVYKYRGSVLTYADLPDSGLTVGDVYNVEETDKNYAWTGAAWDSLGGTVDLSDYALKSEIPTDNAELTNGAGYITGYTDTEIKNKYESNLDTNAYTDSEQTKLQGIEDGAQVNDPNTTTQGNTFNGADQLVQLDANGALPAVDGSNLTDIDSGAVIATDGPPSSPVDGQVWVNRSAFSQESSEARNAWTFSGHSDKIYGLAVSPDGTKLYSGSPDNTVKEINASDGSEGWTFSGHSDSVFGLVVSPDGSKLYSGSFDDTLKEINASDGTEGWTFSGHAGVPSSLAISPDGTKLYSASFDNTVKEINTFDGTEGWTFSGHASNVSFLVISPDGTKLYSGSWDNTVKEINASDGTEGWTFSGHSDRIYGLAVSPDGTKLYSGSRDNTVKEINASDGSEGWTFSGHTDSVWSPVVSPDGTKVYSGAEDNEVKEINASDGSEGWTFSGHASNVSSLAISPDGTKLYSGSWDNTVKEINASDGSTNIFLSDIFQKYQNMIWDNTAQEWKGLFYTTI